MAIGSCCRDFWDADGLAGIDIPTLFIAGSNDETSGYEDGVRALWAGAVNADRALLTYEGGTHNSAAPIPPPEESFFFSDRLGFSVSEHYSDPVWEAVLNNNIAQHFVTSWLDIALKGDTGKSAYLDLVASASNGVWSVNDDGTFKEDHTYWKGFGQGNADGLRYEVLTAAVAPPAPVPLPASVLLLGLALGGLGGLRILRARQSRS